GYRARRARTLRSTHAVQIDQHAGGRPPDVALAISDVPDLHVDMLLPESPPAGAMVRGLECVAQRNLEGILDLALIEQQLEARLHEAHDGRHAVATEQDVVGQIAGKGH